jgi:hypothetical protein
MAYPDLIELSSFNGDFDKYVEAVYAAYIDVLVRGNLDFLGKRISFKHAPATDGKGFAFWHAVSEAGATQNEEDRTIDLRRCERISWAAHMLQSVGDDGSNGEIVWWRPARARKRVVIWIRDQEYAVVLEERDDFWLFWTAYCVKSNRARTFAAEHASFWKL